MPTPKATVSQAELRRYLKAMREAGIADGHVTIEKPDGTRITIGSGKASNDDGATDDFDELIGRIQ